MRSAAASGIKEKPSRASVASRVFESLVSCPASNVVHQQKQVSRAGIGLGHGASHSGTEFLEGFRRFSQEPQKDLFLNQSSSDSARAGFGAGAGRKVRLLLNSYQLSAVSSQLSGNSDRVR